LRLAHDGRARRFVASFLNVHRTRDRLQKIFPGLNMFIGPSVAIERQRARCADTVGAGVPFVLARDSLSRGWRTFFADRLPASNRVEAEALC